MALLRLLSPNARCSRISDFPKAFRVFSYSTEASSPSSSQDSASSLGLKLSGISSTPKETLFRRISSIGKSEVQVSPVLDQWVDEGRGFNYSEVLGTIKQLRVYKRFNQALEVSEWMGKHIKLSPQYAAVRLDLVSKVHGLKEAEEYFDSLPSSLRESKVYGSMLNCYVRAKSTEKAEATMETMRKLGYFTTMLSYNGMLYLYYETKEYGKVEALAQEMEGKGIAGDKYTLNYQLKAYAAKSDIEGIEKIVAKIRADPLISADWTVYIGASNGYMEAGLEDKALEMLKTAEQLIDAKSRRYGYEVLMTSYAKLKNKDEVYRLWDSCKKMGDTFNKAYFAVMTSLYKLDDIEGMEKIYKEWDAAKMTFFDARIPNLLVCAYCKTGLMEKAESVVKQLAENGNDANPTTWDHMATGYYNCGQFEKAVEAMKKATLVSHPGWKPNIGTLTGCTEYLEGKDEEEFAQFRNLLDKHSHPSK